MCKKFVYKIFKGKFFVKGPLYNDRVLDWRPVED